MKKNNLRLIAIMVIMSAKIASACPVMVTNDTKKAVFLYDINSNKNGMLIKPGKTLKFGTGDQHLYFCVMTTKNDADYQRACIIKQHSCSKEPLKYSVNDLLNGKVNMDLFEKPIFD